MNLKRQWRELRDDPPGERFQRRYERRHEEGENPVRRVALLVAGVAVVAAGIFFLPAPGPGMVIVALGVGLIAQESRAAARAADWLEVRIRRLLDWARGVYGNASPAGRALLILLVLLVAAGAAVGAYRLVFGG